MMKHKKLQGEYDKRYKELEAAHGMVPYLSTKRVLKLALLPLLPGAGSAPGAPRGVHQDLRGNQAKAAEAKGSRGPARGQKSTSWDASLSS